MQNRWKVLVSVIAVGAVALIGQKSASKAASAAPQVSTSEKAASIVAPSASGSALVIPDTTLAINSPAPMSERVVHYEIDAKYDAAKHAIDATETLTYHNLTGQSLDHFPFHLYQNAFQPNATWVREAKRDGNRDTSYDK